MAKAALLKLVQGTETRKRPRVNRLPQTHAEMTRKVREPDEFMTFMQNAIKDSGREYYRIAADAMVHFQTVKNIAEGTTRFPANATCDRILSACGLVRKVVRATGAKKKTG